MMASTAAAGSRGKTGIAGFVFFALFWSGMTLAFDGFIGWNGFRQFRSASYSITTGRITYSKVETIHGNKGNTYRPSLKYKYSVAGKDYQGDCYRYGQWSSGDGSARQIVAAHPVGKQVKVHYAPGNPADAVLKAGLQGFRPLPGHTSCHSIF